MKKLSMTLSLLSVVSLVMVAFGCAPEEPEVVVEGPPIAPPREEVSVDASYDGKEVEITADTGALIVTLESNPTTGFEWELVEITNEPEEPTPQEEAEEPVTEPEQDEAEPPKPAVYTGELPEKTVLRHVDNKYVPPEAENIVGGAGKEVWTFHAEGSGKSTISMVYRRLWEEGVEPAKTFTLTVVVK